MYKIYFPTLLFSHSVMSNSLWPHGLQHARLPCSSPSPGVCSNSCPLSWWYYLIISSSAAPFSFCLQSFPASGSFPWKQLKDTVYILHPHLPGLNKGAANKHLLESRFNPGTVGMYCWREGEDWASRFLIVWFIQNRHRPTGDDWGGADSSVERIGKN